MKPENQDGSGNVLGSSKHAYWVTHLTNTWPWSGEKGRG